MLTLLKKLRAKRPAAYQRLRIESVCSRLGLTSLSFLWQREQRALLADMVGDVEDDDGSEEEEERSGSVVDVSVDGGRLRGGVDAVVVKVASIGLLPRRHLNRSLKELQRTCLGQNVGVHRSIPVHTDIL